MNKEKTKKNDKRVIIKSISVLCTKKCVHEYIKDFGIIRCSKCDFKYILFLKPLVRN